MAAKHYDQDDADLFWQNKTSKQTKIKTKTKAIVFCKAVF